MKTIPIDLLTQTYFDDEVEKTCIGFALALEVDNVDPNVHTSDLEIKIKSINWTLIKVNSG